MNKLLYTFILFPLFAIGQTVEDFDFVPGNTLYNTSVLFHTGTLTEFAGGLLMAFDADWIPVGGFGGTGGTIINEIGQASTAIWGSDDYMDYDYLSVGDEVIFAILYNGSIVIITPTSGLISGESFSSPQNIYYPGANYFFDFFSLTYCVLDGYGNCEYPIWGCTDPTYLEFDASANLDDGACATLIVNGCMDAGYYEYADARDQELSDTIADMQQRYDDLMAAVTGDANGSLDHNIGSSYYLDGAIDNSNGILAYMQSALDYHASPLVIDLHVQWNTVAYYLQHQTSVIAQFEEQFGGPIAVAQNINIVKNNEGSFYWPEFNFDGIGQLQPGQGYQVRVKDTSDGKPDFTWDGSIDPTDMRVLTPTVPAWTIEMEVQNHPNDIRTLVRVVNMLGQEVNPENKPSGTVLLYLYNDATVEKKIK